jgi:molybdate transport system regulatory protein
LKSTIYIKGNIWITTSKKEIIGKGRAQLLNEINNCGSIAQAAKNINLSYKKAWCMVKEMNTNYKEPIIKQIVGGKNGGGTNLTHYGLELLNNYNKIQTAFKTFIDQTEAIINKHA